MTDLLVFTDLDGTLLDHHSYSYAAALPALQRLAASATPVVFTSSKTAAEIEALRLELDNRHPFIVENGSAICIPTDYFTVGLRPGERSTATFEVQTFGPTYRELLDQLHRLRTSGGYRFRGFADLATPELARLTDLDVTSAARAQQRHASEPLLWEDTPAALEALRSDLQPYRLKLLKGGRFYHVMGEVDKADALRWLARHYREIWPARHWQIVALGDSPNDRAMLEAADIAVTIPPADGGILTLTRTTGVIVPEEKGPGGWQSAMTRILDHETDQGD